ncbi:MAG: hypothetical protein EAZ08_08515 [Cytophagales bacterium]|nr:MAG: hypothetical protein EAZ08_08515 [Cytophagales bacterium]
MVIEKDTLKLNVPIDFEQLVSLVMQLPQAYKQKLTSLLIDNNSGFLTIDEPLTFEQWNSEFDNQKLQEYLPEYEMTLLEFRKKQWEDEQDTDGQMNEQEFKTWLKTAWKNQIEK